MKILSSLLASFALLSATNNISIQNAVNLSSESSPLIEVSSPLDDLLGLDDFKNDYNNGIYKFRGKGDIQFLNFCEYCYDTTFNESFGLYFYVYNPNQYQPIIVNDSRNNVQLSFTDDDSDNHYFKYNLSFVSKTTGENDTNMFYKFKVNVEDLPNIHFQLNSNERIYNISSIEFKLDDGTNNAKDFLVGNTFKCTGYAKGINGNDESTLSCYQDGLETIRCKTYGGYRRSSFIDQDLTHAKDLFYVYFTIDNKYLENYGQLYQITYEYYLYHLKELYVLKEGLDKDSIPWWMNTDAHFYSNANDAMSRKSWDYVHIYSQFPEKLLFITNAYDTTISKDVIENRVFKNGINVYSNTSKESAYSGVKTATLDDETINVETTSFDYWLYNLNFTFEHHQYEGTDWSNLQVIEKITQEENQSGSIYQINETDVSDFNNLYKSALKKDESMYLFRFYVGDYYTTWIYEHSHAWLTNELYVTNYAKGYRFKSDCIIDFDIISFGFKINNVIKIIPVSSNPINIFVDGTAPPHSSTTVFNWRLLFALLGGFALMLAIYYITYRYTQGYKDRQLRKSVNSISESLNSNKKRRRRK